MVDATHEKTKRVDEGVGVSRAIDDLSIWSAAGSSHRKKGGEFTDGTIQPAVVGGLGLGGTV